MSWRFVTRAALFATCLLTANTIAATLIVVDVVVDWLKARAFDYETDVNPVRL